MVGSQNLLSDCLLNSSRPFRKLSYQGWACIYMYIQSLIIVGNPQLIKHRFSHHTHSDGERNDALSTIGFQLWGHIYLKEYKVNLLLL